MFKKSVCAVVLFAIFFPPMITIIFYMDWNRHYHTHHPGKCRTIKKSGVGSEDLQILSSGLTFITSGWLLNQATPDTKIYVKSKGRGTIQMIDMKVTESQTKTLKIKHGKDFNPDTFRPHGLSVLEDKVKNEHLIYVVSHADEESDRIEKFRYLPNTQELRHEKSFFSDLIHLINDVTVTEEDKFYTGNSFHFTNTFMLHFEMMYRLRLGDVIYYDGSEFTEVQGKLGSPNGILTSEDGRYLYLAVFEDQTIQVYKRKSAYNLQLVQEVHIHTYPDNMHWSESGDSLYIGCHPIKHKLLFHITDHEQNPMTPSQILRVPLKDGLIDETKITEELYDQGDLIAGSAVAGVFKNKMLIGSVVDKLVMCDLPVEST